MEVKISFDTEKESVDDLKKLVGALQDLIAKREKSAHLGNPFSASVTSPTQIRTEPAPAVQQTLKPAPTGQTSGGGRVVPYEDMSKMLSKLASGGTMRK